MNMPFQAMKNNEFIENILRLGQSPFGHRTQLHKHQFNNKTNKNLATNVDTSKEQKMVTNF